MLYAYQAFHQTLFCNKISRKRKKRGKRRRRVLSERNVNQPWRDNHVYWTSELTVNKNESQEFKARYNFTFSSLFPICQFLKRISRGRHLNLTCD